MNISDVGLYYLNHTQQLVIRQKGGENVRKEITATNKKMRELMLQAGVLDLCVGNKRIVLKPKKQFVTEEKFLATAYYEYHKNKGIAQDELQRCAEHFASFVSSTGYRTKDTENYTINIKTISEPKKTAVRI